MKRPLFIAAALVLSGMICGIKESGLTMKAAAFAVTAVLIVLFLSGYFEEKNPLFSVGEKAAGIRQDGSGDIKERNKDNKKKRNSKNDGIMQVLPTIPKHRVYLAAAAMIVFAIGFVRGAVQSHIYNTPECVEFYDYYKPTNPGLFDYSMYLKSLDISSREQYEAYREASGKKSSYVSANESAGGTDNSSGNGFISSSPDKVKSAFDDSTENSSLVEKAPVTIMLNFVKVYCAGIFDSALSEHDSGIYKAVILGDKSDMDTEIRDLYQDAGIAHLLAVSGLHVSMIGASLYNILRRKLNAKKSAAVSSVVLFLYMLLTGASGSVIRAVIMLILNIIAAVYGRNYCMTTAISISAIIVMLYRPYMIFTSGFQLSFGAVASISLISQSITKRIELMLENSEDNNIKATDIGGNQRSGNIIKLWRHLGDGRICRCAERNNENSRFNYGNDELAKYVRHYNRLKAPLKAFIVSASIQLGTLPILAYHFYKVPVYGILLNFIVIPLMAAVIASGLSLIGLWTAVGAAQSFSGIAGRLMTAIGLSAMQGINVTSAGTGRAFAASAATVTNDVFARVGEAANVAVRLLTAVAAAPGHYVLVLYERLSSFTLTLPYSTACIGRPSMLQVIIYYVILAAAIFLILKPRRMVRRRIAYVSLMCFLVFILNANVLKYRDTGKLSITAIDVGQGDSFLIKKGENTILIDGGSSSRSNVGKNVIESFLMAKGISELGLIVVSHADSDHINGVEYLLSDDSNITTDVLVLPAAAEHDADYDELKSLFLYGSKPAGKTESFASNNTDNEKGLSSGTHNQDSDRSLSEARDNIGSDMHTEMSDANERRIIYPQAGSNICSTRDFSLSCLYPGNPGDDKNRQSAVLLLRSGDFTMLFTGDTEEQDEQIFADEEYLRSHGYGDLLVDGRLTVLKAAHHGSHSANTEQLFDTFRPQATLISCGRNNRYGHPHEEVLDRAEESGSRILRTDESGAVSITVDGQEVSIETYK